ncbi:MAG TPA: DnaJ domain-containing protein [Polyangiales bacterium]|nr:DnaJ domain-containing protein [Polyangiales bacterium]
MADEPVATGTLAKTPLPHLLIYLDQKLLSGTLAVWPDVIPEGENRQDRILLLKGRPVAGRLIEPAKTLREGLLKMFYRSEAPYAFYDGNLLGSGEDRLNGRVDPLSLITESLRMTARDAVVDDVLGRVGALKLRMQPKIELPRFEFTQEERTLVELLMAEPATIDSLTSESGMPRARVRRVLYLLLISKAVAPYEPSMPAAARPSVGPTALPSSVPPEGPIPSLPPAAPAASVPPGASGPSKSPAARLDRLADLPSPPPGLSPELTERWQKITTRARLIENQNYFEMLGLDKKATAADAKSEFFKSAKEWHPDRLQPELAPLRPAVEIIFGYLNEAHKVLGDAEELIAYQRTVREGGGTPAAERLMQQILDSAIAYERVLVFARRHQVDEALELLQKILNITKDEPDYHAMLGSLLMQKYPGPDAPIAKITEALDRAIELHADHEKAQLYKAQLLKRLGRNQEALRHFKRVVSINPNNLDAAREVRVANMREENKDKTVAKSPAGLLGKLLGNSEKPSPKKK